MALPAWRPDPAAGVTWPASPRGAGPCPPAPRPTPRPWPAAAAKSRLPAPAPRSAPLPESPGDSGVGGPQAGAWRKNEDPKRRLRGRGMGNQPLPCRMGLAPPFLSRSSAFLHPLVPPPLGVTAHPAQASAPRPKPSALNLPTAIAVAVAASGTFIISIFTQPGEAASLTQFTDEQTEA